MRGVNLPVNVVAGHFVADSVDMQTNSRSRDWQFGDHQRVKCFEQGPHFSVRRVAKDDRSEVKPLTGLIGIDAVDCQAIQGTAEKEESKSHLAALPRIHLAMGNARYMPIDALAKGQRTLPYRSRAHRVEANDRRTAALIDF